LLREFISNAVGELLTISDKSDKLLSKRFPAETQSVMHTNSDQFICKALACTILSKGVVNKCSLSLTLVKHQHADNLACAVLFGDLVRRCSGHSWLSMTMASHLQKFIDVVNGHLMHGFHHLRRELIGVDEYLDTASHQMKVGDFLLKVLA
jgi:hypothetical protein